MTEARRGAGANAAGGRILIVGDSGQWAGEGRAVPDIEGLVFVDHESLAAALGENPPPTTIISLLVGTGFDAVDVAVELHRHRYKGRYRAIAGQIPNPDVVAREIKSVAPCLDFAVITPEDLFR